MVTTDDDDFPLPRVSVQEQMLHIQPGQVTSHNHNMNQILYVMNTALQLQFGRPCLQDDQYMYY